MNTEIITAQGKKYLKAEVIEVRQKNKYFYLAKTNAKDFINIYTVRPAKYDLKKHTELARSFPNEQDYYEHLITVDQKNIDHKDFQREANIDRVSSISKFLEQEDFALFPNTIIANCEVINNSEGFFVNQNSSLDDFISIVNKPSYLCFLQEDNGKFFLYIPYEENSVLVIDGQHRLEGLKRTSEDFQTNYELIISFIIGYDRSIIAKQFYTINYEQKSVNKSLLYQLTGEFSNGVGEISYLHTAIKLLNELEDSPLYGRIKMLGITPRNTSIEEKQKLTISQAFLIDSTVRLITASAKNTIYPPIFLYYYQHENLRIEIIKTIARFLSAVKILRPDWNTPEDSILSKGMGVGALIKVLNLIYPLIFQEHNFNWQSMQSLKPSDFVEYLSGIEKVDFSTSGRYGGVGSGGTINKLKEEIIRNNLYFGPFTDYSEFENKHKTDIIYFSNYL